MKAEAYSCLTSIAAEGGEGLGGGGAQAQGGQGSRHLLLAGRCHLGTYVRLLHEVCALRPEQPLRPDLHSAGGPSGNCPVLGFPRHSTPCDSLQSPTAVDT